MRINLYYKVWADCIMWFKIISQQEKSWKRLTMVYMSIAMTINFLVIMSIIQRHILKHDLYGIGNFPGTILGNTFQFFVLYFLPMVIINYFFIFNNDRYKNILNKYKTYKGRLFFTYLSVSLLLPLIVLIVLKSFF